MKDEQKEDLEKLRKMSSYDRLVHLRKVAIFHKQIGEDNRMVQEVLLITRDYDN